MRPLRSSLLALLKIKKENRLFNIDGEQVYWWLRTTNFTNETVEIFTNETFPQHKLVYRRQGCCVKSTFVLIHPRLGQFFCKGGGPQLWLSHSGTCWHHLWCRSPVHKEGLRPAGATKLLNCQVQGGCDTLREGPGEHQGAKMDEGSSGKAIAHPTRRCPVIKKKAYE